MLARGGGGGPADLFLRRGGVGGCEEAGLKVLLSRLGSGMSLSG